MLGQNKGTSVGGSYHHALTLSLSKAPAKILHRAGSKVTIIHGVNLNLIDWYYSGCQVAQVQTVFQLLKNTIHKVCPSLDTSPPTHLAYIEWFSLLMAAPDPKHLMYQVSKLRQGEEWHAGIIPVDWIISSIHLLPCFGPVVPHDWNSFTVSENCQTYYLNPFADVQSYHRFV